MTLDDPKQIQLFPDTPLYTMRATLNGQEYTLRFDYAQREDRWYLSLYDAAGLPIRKGIKITSNVSTLRLTAFDARAPLGYLTFSDVTKEGATAAAGTPPGYADLGRRVSLLYFARLPDVAESVTIEPLE